MIKPTKFPLARSAGVIAFLTASLTISTSFAGPLPAEDTGFVFVEFGDTPDFGTPMGGSIQERLDAFAKSDFHKRVVAGRVGADIEGEPDIPDIDDDTLPTNPNNTPGQLVFLDFDSARTDTFTVGFRPLGSDEDAPPPEIFTAPNGVSEFETHVYTQAERDAIEARLEEDYAGFNVSFTQEMPTSGEFATLQYNNTTIRGPGFQNIVISEIDNDEDGSPDGLSISILFGEADGIDFRNLVKDDVARTDANLWTFLRQGGLNFSGLSGLPDNAAGEATAILNQSVNTGSHEVGHNLGLRHHDALGPLGEGTTGFGNTAGTRFVPPFPGPANAFETFGNIMASGASTGLPITFPPRFDREFSERSATKLAFNEQGTIQNEDDLVVATFPSAVTIPLPDLFNLGDNVGVLTDLKRLTLETLDVPPDLVDPNLKVKAGAVRGSLELASITPDGQILLPVDLFEFTGNKGDLFSFELMSLVIDDRRSFDFSSFISEIAIFDDALNLVPWFDFPAINICEGESCDSFLFDLTLPTTGTFFIGVWSPLNLILASGIDLSLTFGDYELFVVQYIPAPAAILLFAPGLAFFAWRRRRRATA